MSIAGTSMLGCEKRPVVGSAQARTVDEVVPPKIAALPSKTLTPIRLEHDFKIVKPGETKRHRFKIHNESRIRWTFAKFHTSCSCTASQVTATAIEPGRTEEIEVSYKVPTAETDDQRAIEVEFAEKDAPNVSLIVKSSVREELSLSTDALTFHHVGRGKNPEGSFEVRNYSDREIARISLSPSAHWLKVDSFALENEAYRGQNGRRAWRISVRAETAELNPGRYRERIDIQADDQKIPSRHVYVDLALTKPVEAVPSQMFFGSIAPQKTSKQKILLMFSPDSTMPNAGAIHLAHNLGDRLSLYCERSSSRYWELIGSLSPAEGDQLVEGTIRLDFTVKGLPSLKIPVTALVRKP